MNRKNNIANWIPYLIVMLALISLFSMNMGTATQTLSYNDLQKAQGLDLSEYKGKSAMRYTYEITNYPDYDGTVYANIIVYKNRVIGGDICSSGTQGFIQGFELPSDSQ